MTEYSVYVGLAFHKDTFALAGAVASPHAYLKAALEAIADGHPASDIDQLLPWAFTPISN